MRWDVNRRIASAVGSQTISIIAASLLIAVLATAVSTSARPAIVDLAKWEYGQLHWNPSHPGKLAWDTATVSLDAEKSTDLCEKLGGPIGKTGIVSVLNRLGSDGWELECGGVSG